MRPASLILLATIVTFLSVSLLVGDVFAHGDKKRYESDVRYSTHIAPLFEKQCAGCHGKGSPEHVVFMGAKDSYVSKSIGPRMDNYTFLISFIGWPDTGAVMRRLDDGTNTADGKPGNMYKHLGSTDEERRKNLDIFKKWVGNWSLDRYSKVEKKDLDGMQLSY